jgi:hypothetical protein
LVGIGALTVAITALRISTFLASIGMAASWAVAFWPVTLAVGALALVGVAAYELWKHWDEIVNNMREGWEQFVSSIESAPHDLKVAFGLGTNEEDAAAAKKQAAFGSGSGVSAPGADVIWRNPMTGLEETHRAGWIAPGSAGSSGGGGGTVNNSVNVAKIEVNGAQDPKATADEVSRRLTRTAQSGRVR